jgi:serine/threonine-protein kinase
VSERSQKLDAETRRVTPPDGEGARPTRVAPYSTPTVAPGDDELATRVPADERPTSRKSPAAHTLPDATVREVMPLGARVGAAQVETLDGETAVKPRETWGCPLCGATYARELETCPIDGEPLLVLSWIHTEADALVGCTVHGRYEIESVLGKGGMGTVYQVRHKTLGKRFALKVLRREVAIDADSVQRFIQEAQIAATVKHPYLADVSDCGEITSADVPALGAAHLPFFVMEMLKGQSLGDRLRARGSIDAALAAEILKQCALGLSAAHAAGVVHRDLKPDNIFLSESEGRLVCKILDFGVAKILSKAKLTKAGTVFGTPCYMAPEQASGGTLDGRTDIYALGVVMYEALSGRVPFSDETHMGVLTKHVFEVPEPIELVVEDPRTLGPLGPIVMRCLEKDPDARYADAMELHRTVEEAVKTGYVLPPDRPQPAMRLREPTPIARTTTSTRPEKGARRWLWAVAVGVTCLAAGALALLFTTSPSDGRRDGATPSSAAASAPPLGSPARDDGPRARSAPSATSAPATAPDGSSSPSPSAASSTVPSSMVPSSTVPSSTVPSSPSAARGTSAPPGTAKPAGSGRRPSEVVETW